jgi:4-amino-4-deoxy-L-arabinose transferase-like glycosyltransferase
MDLRTWFDARSRRPIALVLFVFVVLSLLYIWIVPPFEGPDEAQHFAYVTWLIEEKSLPPQGEAAWETPVEQEAGQPPLYYLLASLPARLVDLNNPPATYHPNPHFVGPFPRTVPDNDNRAIHYPGEVQPLRGGWLAFYMMRVLTMLFGLVLIVSVYGVGRNVLPSRPEVALMAATLVALTPQVIYIGGVVSNDIPAAALSAITLWLFTRMFREGARPFLALATGLALGVAALFKVSSLVMVAPLGLGLAWLGLSRRYPWRDVLKNGVLLGLGAFLVAGWWFVRSWVQYGSPFGLETHDLTPWAITRAEMLAEPLARWEEVWRTYWMAFGWATIRPERWVYRSLSFLAVVAVIGLGLAGWRWLRNRQRGFSTTAVLMILLLVTVLTFVPFLEFWMRRVIAPYGRLLYPALAAIAILFTLGWQKIHPRLPLVACLWVGLLALVSPFTVIRSAYSSPSPLTDAEVNELGPRPGWRFGWSVEHPIAELLGAVPLERTVEVGQLLPVRVCWRVLEVAEGDYSILLHIIGPENALIAQRRTFPGLGRFPTSAWQPGVAFCDLIRVRVVDNVTETQVYKIEVGMIDEKKDERLQIFNATGDPESNLFVGFVKLVAPEGLLMASGVADGPPIQLIDYDFEALWTAGGFQTITLEWGVATPVDIDYQVFVHLRDMVTGEPVAQADGPPREGWYPTSWWEAGERIVDRRSFDVPATVPPARYQLVVGLYDLASRQRLGGENILGTVEVLP